MTKHTLPIQKLCMMGTVTSMIAVMAQIVIPMPVGVPMTMQSLAVSLAGILLGPKYGAVSTLIYLFAGAVGIPVFSAFTGGLQCLLGPTGGFLISFPLMALIIGLGTQFRARLKGLFTLSLIVGNLINLLCGAVFYCIITKSTFTIGITTCVLPFLPVTILKMVLAGTLGLPIRKYVSRM